eukprot:1180150-Prorocentrum_minimum.AAC.4
MITGAAAHRHHGGHALETRLALVKRQRNGLRQRGAVDSAGTRACLVTRLARLGFCDGHRDGLYHRRGWLDGSGPERLRGGHKHLLRVVRGGGWPLQVEDLHRRALVLLRRKVQVQPGAEHQTPNSAQGLLSGTRSKRGESKRFRARNNLGGESNSPVVERLNKGPMAVSSPNVDLKGRGR